MLDKVKKYSVIIIMAILFTAFSFSIVDLIFPQPDYQDFCSQKPVPARPLEKTAECTDLAVSEAEQEDCNSRRGFIEYDYGSNGCPESYTCNTCNAELDEAGKDYRLKGFIITSIMAVLAIIIGLYVSSKKDVVEWVFSGFLIGGIMTLAFGTISYFRDMGRFVKPVVLLCEMAIIVWIAVRAAKKAAKKE